ncbi:MAG: YtxH domain-containing protein [Deltaproteobacteria bacterium]
MRRTQSPELVYVERSSDSSAKWLFWGALLGAGLALLYAPRSGEETRRLLQRRLWKLRAMTEEKVDELSQRFGGSQRALDGLTDEDEDEEVEEEPLPRPQAARAAASGGARQELEHRLAEARARRRAAGTAEVDVEEPLA